MRPLNVLFLSSDDLVARVRILPMLEILQASGRIAFVVVDRDLHVTGRVTGSFDVCLAHRNPGKRQIAWLRGRPVPLLYDIDDLLLPGGDGQAVRWALDHAQIVTAPSQRLLATLDAAMGGGLALKTVLLPNAGRETPRVQTSHAAKPNLIWMSSAIPQADHKLADVCRGIADAATRLTAETLLVGRFSQPTFDLLPRAKRIAWIEPANLLDWMAEQPLIAVAPLSTDLPAAQQLFADCKSDIKIAQYGSSGIVGVYSNAIPYAESDLPRRLVRENDAMSWTNEIVDAARNFAAEGATLAQDAAFARRRPSALADRWLIELQRVATMGRPFTFNAIATPRFAREIEKRFRRWLR